MSSNEKKKKNRPMGNSIDNRCPQKEGDNCKVPGVYGDSEPIGGGG